ncbi:MAG TPA: ABC transporter substrate-binding protein, partial [Spirochaetales bacterium]|nr:ABC transporter substrate-binding protein [Spirochaetales bacterium]
MKAKQRTILILGLVLAVAAVVAAVFFLWKPQPKGITVAVSNLPDSLNPIMAQNTSGMNASELVFDGLVNFEVDSQGRSLYPELALAESIEQDPVTKKTYTVLLREVFWHDGSELTANDVVYSFNAYMDPANESPSKPYLSSFIEKVEAVDSRTVRIEFHKPLPPFRVYPVLTFKIIPSSYRGARMDTNLRAGENERNFAVEPVGTGPYRLTGWEIGKWVSFAANGTYFRRVPSIETLLMKK